MSIAEPIHAERPDWWEDARLDPAFDAIVRTVRARVGAVAGRDIERIVAEELLRFRDARVTSFIPVLVERAAIARLTRIRSIDKEATR